MGGGGGLGVLGVGEGDVLEHDERVASKRVSPWSKNVGVCVNQPGEQSLEGTSWVCVNMLQRVGRSSTNKPRIHTQGSDMLAFGGGGDVLLILKASRVLLLDTLAVCVENFLAQSTCTAFARGHLRRKLAQKLAKKD